MHGILSSGLIVLLCGAQIAPNLSAQPPAPTQLNIEIIDGEGAVNNLRLRTAREPIVEVTDENHKPVAGALVLFTAPDHGASGTFSNGATQLRATTDAQGRAVARGFQPNAVKGPVELQVEATFAGLRAARVIHSINQRAGLPPTAKWLLVAGAVAGVAAGVAIGVTSGGSGRANTGTTITPGAPSVGGPH